MFKVILIYVEFKAGLITSLQKRVEASGALQDFYERKCIEKSQPRKIGCGDLNEKCTP